MSNSQDRAALKKAVYDRLLSLESEELATAVAHYEAHMQGSVLDDREGHDTDDLATSTEEVGLAAAFHHPVMTHHAKVDVIENLDFAPCDTVRSGAIVTLDGRHLVVAVSTARFDVDGVTYMGISPESPIFKAMNGLKAGESFDFQGREIGIEDVL
ncbi:hypothetical protein [Antarcticimicrobium luteum]|uniref:Transcription elongation factor GreA/GreB C-terminal domain-containing protein n=1 Tax=Antarcticimicrobium luteum TaxID=2547397 RepID=A0A4R5VG48_9RHOB|nr:hypothetical protein [Antarcticimicrobium luteum]TDK51793.1 hypothetical protein E1832_02550 [Antarcticimicrobium luteum]